MFFPENGQKLITRLITPKMARLEPRKRPTDARKYFPDTRRYRLGLMCHSNKSKPNWLEKLQTYNYVKCLQKKRQNLQQKSSLGPKYANWTHKRINVINKIIVSKGLTIKIVQK